MALFHRQIHGGTLNDKLRVRDRSKSCDNINLSSYTQNN